MSEIHFVGKTRYEDLHTTVSIKNGLQTADGYKTWTADCGLRTTLVKRVLMDAR